MTTTARGVTIKLDVERKLRFDGVALLRLEDITGMTVLQVCRQFRDEDDDAVEVDGESVDTKKEIEKAERRAQKFSFTLICQIAQAGLTGELPKATTEDVVTLMDHYGKGDGTIQRIMSYTVPVFGALTESIGADSKNAKADPGKKKKIPGRPVKDGTGILTNA